MSTQTAEPIGIVKARLAAADLERRRLHAQMVEARDRAAWAEREYQVGLAECEALRHYGDEIAATLEDQ